MTHSAFICLRKKRIDSLHIEVEEYQHGVTGAKHIHLSAKDNNNVFLVGFLTVPQDSTGVAHILEHVTLCGSQRYPVRSPFFMMTRRSLNTFMNAFTSNDWTVYPFASQNKKDFNNLLKVYLDSVFFPKLDELDFAQEGYRIEFETPDDPSTPLVYKGVVLNEMKGAMSSPVQILWQTVHAQLFPTLTYHYISGGDPLEIPTLTYAQLKGFHATHYHPSNAIFMTYGDSPAAEHQAIFQDFALQYFRAIDVTHLQILDEKRFKTPQSITTYYPFDEYEETQNKTHIVIAWLLYPVTHTREMLNLHVLTNVLLDNSAAPLRHALETCKMGSAPSPLCGSSQSRREASFFCGVEDANPEQADALESLVLEVLEKIEKQGVPLPIVESVLHRLELKQREISGDSWPYGLNLLINALSPAVYGGDPIAALDIDHFLTDLRKDCKNPDFIPQLIRRFLLDNQHRVRVIMTPDNQLSRKRTEQELSRLNTLKAGMSEADKARIITQAKALKDRQNIEDDPEILPKLNLSDVPADIAIPEGVFKPVKSIPTTWFAEGTNGMVYQTIFTELPDFEEELLNLLPLFCNCLTGVGCGDKNYQEAAIWQAAVSGGVNARVSVHSTVEDSKNILGVFSLSGKALQNDHAELTLLLQSIFKNPRFDELLRLRELISRNRANNDYTITKRGHTLVTLASTSALSPVGALSHYWRGFESIRALRKLDNDLEDEKVLITFAEKLAEIQHQLSQMPRQLVVVSEAIHQQAIESVLNQRCQEEIVNTQLPIFKHYHTPSLTKQAWHTRTQVNFCAKSYATIPMGHTDSAALTVLGDFLNNGFLHHALREQGGAYGGGVHYDGDTCTFTFYSSRDPRLFGTLMDFDKSLKWFKKTHHHSRALEEAILSTIARLDRLSSPAKESVGSFFKTFYGYTPERRRHFRSQILGVTLEDLMRVCLTYLNPEHGNIALLSNAVTLQHLPEELGFKIYEL